METLITDFDSPRIILSTIVRLRTHHYKDMGIDLDEARSFVQCKNCPEIQLLTPKHIFEFPAFHPSALKFSLILLMVSLQEILFSQNASELAAEVVPNYFGV
ncbi:hypothetical protein TNCV_2235701 [Trichonephila clavipes]|nr:hypothetical protein TNCV_2235701 [Trichonephila clavipes]